VYKAQEENISVYTTNVCQILYQQTWSLMATFLIIFPTDSSQELS